MSNELSHRAKTFLLLFSFFIMAFAGPKASGSDGKYCVENIEKDETILRQQMRDAKDWALINGMTFSVPSQPIKCRHCGNTVKGIVMEDLAQFVPFSLYPSPFPRELFHLAMNVHRAFQLIYFRAMFESNYEFVKEVHKSAMEVDTFPRSFANSIEAMHKKGIRQPLILYCNRADYFASEVIDEKTKETKYELKQVEVNGGTIGGYVTSSRVAALHRRMLTNAGIDASSEDVPNNQTSTMVATAMHKAWSEFGNDEAVVIFVHANYRNFVLIESRSVQYELERISNFKTKCFFLSLGEGIKRLTLDPDTHSLILDGKYVVAVSASRNSVPKNDAEWEVRRAIRDSTVIQVNPYFITLTQSKKMQQALSKPGVVEKFLRGTDQAHWIGDVRKVLTKSWSIGADEENAEEIIRRAKEKPDEFVLKWNECTNIGDNKVIFFGDELAQKLDTMPREEREKYFLMEKLRPMKAKNHFVRTHSEPLLNVEATAELGIHGCLLGNLADGTVLDYFWPESQMRTKLAEVDEGGVMKGNSVVDSPYLI